MTATAKRIKSDVEDYYNALVEGNAYCDEIYSRLVDAIKVAQVSGYISAQEKVDFLQKIEAL